MNKRDSVAQKLLFIEHDFSLVHYNPFVPGTELGFA